MQKRPGATGDIRKWQWTPRNLAMAVTESIVSHAQGRETAFRVGRFLYSRGRYDFPNDTSANGEMRLIELLAPSLAGGDVLVDIGANNGLWTQGALARAPGVVVHAFEPVPSTARQFEANLRDEIATGSVVLHGEAVSADVGSITMNVFPAEVDKSGINSLLQQAGPQTLPVPVPVVTIDEIVNRLASTRVRLVKIDTEGNDFSVLLGARDTLRSGSVDLIQFEYNSRWIDAKRYLRDVFDLTADLKYGVGKVLPWGVEVYDAWHPEMERYFESNYLLVRDGFDRRIGAARTVFGPTNAPRPGR